VEKGFDKSENVLRGRIAKASRDVANDGAQAWHRDTDHLHLRREVRDGDAPPLRVGVGTKSGVYLRR
jgi:hypothetical protein